MCNAVGYTNLISFSLFLPVCLPLLRALPPSPQSLWIPETAVLKTGFWFNVALYHAVRSVLACLKSYLRV